jgi:hypothetical protein
MRRESLKEEVTLEDLRRRQQLKEARESAQRRQLLADGEREKEERRRIGEKLKRTR